MQAILRQGRGGLGRAAVIMAAISLQCFAVPAVAQARIWGYADLHNHQFVYEGFGRTHFFGKAFGPLDEALPWCTPAHGPAGLLDLATQILRPMYGGSAAPGHHVHGFPEFGGWPRWDNVTHQAVHEEMLLRAVQGGLRLMVVLALNNEWTCSTLNAFSTADHGLRIANPALFAGLVQERILNSQFNIDSRCRDMDAVDRQIAEAYRMQDYIDSKSGGPGKGWYRIVTSPAEARRAASSGKLAVVLGSEVDSLFGCDKNSGCTQEYVRTKLDEYFAKGLRHVYPIHFYDNAFGGAANSNLLITERWKNPISTVRCAQLGYEYDEGQCNSLGLTSLGKFLIEQMANRGMIIDIDHMSRRSFNDTMDILGPRRYPVVSGHTGFVALSQGDKKNEGNKTPTDLARIRAVGGMVAIIPHQGNLQEIGTARLADRQKPHVLHTCGNSSETVLQAYLYAIDEMAGRPVAVGTDLNGFAGLPGPRRGAEACPGGAVAGYIPRPPLSYPFVLNVDGVSLTLPPSSVGNRVFDFNHDGLAHVGMLPDMFADFVALGLNSVELTPLFRSAEGYIQLWERALGVGWPFPADALEHLLHDDDE